MSQITTTAEDRIADMKARVAEKGRREAAEKQREDRISALTAKVESGLMRTLLPLAGLPVLPNGEVQIDDADGNGAVTVRRYGWMDLNGEPTNDRPALIYFTICTNHEGTEAWVEHDDEPITLDIALDLATATVEAILDA